MLLEVTAGTTVAEEDPRATAESIAEGKPKAEAKVSWERPETLEECVTKFGAEVVLDHFEAQALRNLSNRVRADLANGLTEEQIKEKYENGGYVPGVSRTADPQTKLLTTFNQMDVDTQAASLRTMLTNAAVPEDQIEVTIEAHYARHAAAVAAANGQEELFEDEDEDAEVEEA